MRDRAGAGGGAGKAAIGGLLANALRAEVGNLDLVLEAGPVERAVVRWAVKDDGNETRPAVLEPECAVEHQ